MNSSLKLVLVALVSAVLTGGAVYTYFHTAEKTSALTLSETGKVTYVDMLGSSVES